MKLGIITYYWPPAGGPGVQRWLKLSKYLARDGIELFIVTVDAYKATYPLRDEGLYSDVVDGVTVVRTNTNEKFGAYKKFTGKKKVPFSGFSGENSKVGFIQKVARFVRGNFFVPDARKGWNSHAYKAAAKIIEEQHVQHWITTSPPHSTQLVGLRLKKNYGVNWTADFRDPWTDIYYYRKFYPTAITRAYERSLERKVFTSCDQLISVSTAWSQSYIAKGAQPESKVHTITNGFDKEDFQRHETTRPEVFTITYAGTLAAQYPVVEFVKALNCIGFRINLKVIGSWDGLSKERFEKCKSHIQLEFIDYVPKQKLNSMMMSSHLSLFLLPEVDSAKGHVPGKLFDYMGAGNPILGLGPIQGDAAKIIRSVNAGDIFSYENTQGIVDFIKAHKENCPRLDSALTHKYERSLQAKAVLQAISVPCK
ncbi:MAG: glycosyltransferase [Bacteroidota bacterium]|nr:glycosyltransferase [Bacteroidota bacterium]